MTPPTGPSGTTGPPDRQTLRLLEKHLRDDPLVAATSFEPSTHELRSLRAELDADRYPVSVVDTHLDVRWFVSGDFSFHYNETHDSGRWECRWDRHPNEHNARLHFHRPPDGNAVETLSLEDTHPLDLYSIVLGAVEERIDHLWEDSTESD